MVSETNNLLILDVKRIEKTRNYFIEGIENGDGG